MRMDLTVTEFVELINQIRHEPESLFSMIRTNVQETVGKYLSRLMDVELTEFLGRGRYERSEGDSDHRNGSYSRKFTLKGVGEVGVKVPRDRNGEFKTQVLPRSKQYEDALREDISVMFLARVSTRTTCSDKKNWENRDTILRTLYDQVRAWVHCAHLLSPISVDS